MAIVYLITSIVVTIDTLTEIQREVLRGRFYF